MNKGFIEISVDEEKDIAELKFDYNKKFIKALKKIPQKFRKYNDETKIWTISEYKNLKKFIEQNILKYFAEAMEQIVKENGKIIFRDIFKNKEMEQLNLFNKKK